MVARHRSLVNRVKPGGASALSKRTMSAVVSPIQAGSLAPTPDSLPEPLQGHDLLYGRGIVGGCEDFEEGWTRKRSKVCQLSEIKGTEG
jgi:hypothetical protein